MENGELGAALGVFGSKDHEESQRRVEDGSLKKAADGVGGEAWCSLAFV